METVSDFAEHGVVGERVGAHAHMHTQYTHVHTHTYTRTHGCAHTHTEGKIDKPIKQLGIVVKAVSHSKRGRDRKGWREGWGDGQLRPCPGGGRLT